MHYIFDRELAIVNKNLTQLYTSIWIIPVFLKLIISGSLWFSIIYVAVHAFIFRCDCRLLRLTGMLTFQRPTQSQIIRKLMWLNTWTSQTTYTQKATVLAGTGTNQNQLLQDFPNVTGTALLLLCKALQLQWRFGPLNEFFPFGPVSDAVLPIYFHFCYIALYIILPPIFRSS